MKITSSFPSFLFIVFLTLAIHYSPHLSTAKEDDCDRFLCDADWNHVKSDKAYYLSPPTDTVGGDIYLGNDQGKRNPCPRFGMMYGSRQNTGDRFIFTPVVPNDDGLVPLATPFMISSDEEYPKCDDTGMLRMTHKDNAFKFWHVTVNGEFNKSSSCFQFVNFPVPTEWPYHPTYQLENCPYKCGRGTGECFHVGNKTLDYENYFLTTDGYPYPLEFIIRREASLEEVRASS